MEKSQDHIRQCLLHYYKLKQNTSEAFSQWGLFVRRLTEILAFYRRDSQLGGCLFAEYFWDSNKKSQRVLFDS